MFESLRNLGARRAFRLPLLLAGVGVALALARHWPTLQSLHVVLGDAAPRVLELRLRYAEPTAERDWQREATFHYARGQAPRIVSHEPKLVSGDYDVEIEVSLADGPAQSHVVTTLRRLTLAGGSSSVDVSRALLAGSP